MQSVPAEIERANQYATVSAEKAFSQAASLTVLAAIGFIFDPNQQGTVRIRYIRRSVLSTKIAVAGPGSVHARGPCEFHFHTNVAAMATSAYFMHGENTYCRLEPCRLGQTARSDASNWEACGAPPPKFGLHSFCDQPQHQHGFRQYAEHFNIDGEALFDGWIEKGEPAQTGQQHETS